MIFPTTDGSMLTMVVLCPMPVWSPTSTPLMSLAHASTHSCVPRICTWMGPQRSTSLFSCMWHLMTPLVCRMVSMVVPCRPKRWPLKRAGTSMILSSIGAPGSGVTTSGITTPLFVTTPVRCPGGAAREGCARAPMSAATAESTLEGLLGSPDWALAAWPEGAWWPASGCRCATGWIVPVPGTGADPALPACAAAVAAAVAP
mmetsp:Transcript_47972/g.133307  ORF Transcript_47972/g.133307 Transcript_47972/m.133307 type:complete len:202 (+) Transcript_47972:974-1579(+)